MSKVYVKSNVNEATKLTELDNLLKESEFWEDIERVCTEVKKQTKESCKIVIKPNISIASQKALQSYTDPMLVEHLVEELNQKGYNNAIIVESENMYAIGFPEHTPDKAGKNIGYIHPVINLTTESTECFDNDNPKTHICLSERMLNADYIINFPKGRNHCIYKITGAMKNMFGTIPVREKVYEFHNKESGMNVIEAIQFVHQKTPPNFTIMDWIISVDGEDEHFSKEALSYHKNIGKIIASKNTIAVDTYLQQKMGYQPFESEITQPFKNNTEIEVIGDNLDVIKDWKKVPWKTRAGFKTLFKIMHIAKKSPKIEKEMKKTLRKSVLMDVTD